MHQESCQITPTNKDFDAMEAAARLIDDVARSTIVQVLREFERDCTLEGRLRKRTELAADLDKIGARVQRIRRKHGPFWDESASGKSDLSAKLRAGEKLQQPQKAHRQALRPKDARV